MYLFKIKLKKKEKVYRKLLPKIAFWVHMQFVRMSQVYIATDTCKAIAQSLFLFSFNFST
jgi:hypothetical protein